jgi:hypothetical protein
MGRKKAARIRETALARGWLSTKKSLQDESELASVFPRNAEDRSSGSLALPYAQEVTAWHLEGIRGTTIHHPLVCKYGFNGIYSAVRRYLQGQPELSQGHRHPRF